ncbi:hypothetical protein NOVOSPHI9U_350001 [Novosphingobium sp. 9U]|nr:hypothetical protein NOVOSPHI9U_350001 [Novosphingobium sp. 9U]
MLGPVTNREPVLHHTGEQPPASAPIAQWWTAPSDYTMFMRRGQGAQTAFRRWKAERSLWSGEGGNARSFRRRGRVL